MHADEPRHFGSGWLSGTLSSALGLLGLGAVLCFRYPALLTMPELRALYPVPYVRALLHVVLVASFGLGLLSVCLRRRKTLGSAGIAFTLVAALLGGSRVPVDGEIRSGPFLGVDWFLLNVILYSAIFIPLERFFALRAEQPVFRREWRTDLAYFFVSSLLVQVLTLLTLQPAMVLFDWARTPALAARVAALPGAVQFAAILVLTDLTQYWIHRAFHRVPALWRFHAVHHSAETMDWLAGSRLHLVDVAVTRGLTYVPIHVLGFAEGPLFAYVAFVSIQATFIHANVRFRFGPLRALLATPQFHHWHHAADPAAVDKNFAVHLPVLDRLFGSHYLPEDRWPAAYGIAGGAPVPEGYLAQLAHPFRAPVSALDSPDGAAMMPQRPASETAREDAVRDRRGFTLIELLIVVAIIAIIAAVAIPALLRSRVSANESATIGDVRAILSAQAGYHSTNGGLYDGNLDCLTAPQACIPSYPASGPNFLDSNMASLATKSGYTRSFVPGPPPGIVPPTVSPTSVTGYKYDARPVVVGQTGLRGFAGDHSGRVCYTPDGTVVPTAAAGGMDRNCNGIQ